MACHSLSLFRLFIGYIRMYVFICYIFIQITVIFVLLDSEVMADDEIYTLEPLSINQVWLLFMSLIFDRHVRVLVVA